MRPLAHLTTALLLIGGAALLIYGGILAGYVEDGGRPFEWLGYLACFAGLALIAAGIAVSNASKRGSPPEYHRRNRS